MFRPVHKGGKLLDQRLSAKSVCDLVKTYSTPTILYAHHVGLDSAPSVAAERLLDQGSGRHRMRKARRPLDGPTPGRVGKLNEGSPFQVIGTPLRAADKKLHFGARRHCQGHNMDIMRRQLMRLSAIAAAIVATPRLASAINPETDGAFKLAMGPVSAPLKMGGPPSAPGNTIATCMPSEGSCQKPHHRLKRRRPGSDVPAK
jgi:hypothetical protein